MLLILPFLNFVAFTLVRGNNLISEEFHSRNQDIFERNGKQLRTLGEISPNRRQSESAMESLFTWSNIRLGAVHPLVVPDWYYPRVSEHFLDPYSLTHVIHGYIFYYVGGDHFKEMPGLGFGFSLGVETLWEVFENSDLIINRYRETSGTSRQYEGDSVLNSVGDLLATSVGYWIAAIMDANQMGWVTLVLALVSEVGLLFYMRDNFFLTSMSQFIPVDSIASWQERGIPEEFQPTKEISHSGLNIAGYEVTQQNSELDAANENRIKIKMIAETLLAVLFNAFLLNSSDSPYYLKEKL